jgi:adenylyl cyclase-associated protein
MSVIDSTETTTHSTFPVTRHNPTLLTGLISRLEAATSRLEDIASSTAGVEVSQSNVNGVAPSSAAARAPVSSPVPAPIAKESLPPVIEDFDTLIYGDVKAYHTLSKAPAIGGILGEQVGTIHPRAGLR